MTVGSLVGALNNPHPYPSYILLYSVERHILRQPRVDTRWMEFVLARENLYPEADAASKTEFID